MIINGDVRVRTERGRLRERRDAEERVAVDVGALVERELGTVIRSDENCVL